MKNGQYAFHFVTWEHQILPIVIQANTETWFEVSINDIIPPTICFYPILASRNSYIAPDSITSQMLDKIFAMISTCSAFNRLIRYQVCICLMGMTGSQFWGTAVTLIPEVAIVLAVTHHGNKQMSICCRDR